MRFITEEQDRIGWANVAEGRTTQMIRDMQTMYMCNRETTYTGDHWMRDFIKNLMCLHNQWLRQNLVKYHRIKGSIAIKTKKS